MTSLQLAAPPVSPPRFRTGPRPGLSAGEDVVDLAASAGLVLDDAQRLAVIDGLGHEPDGRWSAPEVAVIEPRQNGKGAILEARTLGSLFLFGEKLILWTSHEFKTSREGFLRIRALIDGADHLRRRVKAVRTGAGEEGIEMLSGARLRFIARSRGSGRGFSADLVLLDEAYALTDEHMAAILPTLSARPNAQTWYTSSAPLVDSVVLRRLMRRGRLGSGGLAYLEWCAPDDAADDDRAAWYAANPALGHRLSESAVERELGSMATADFRRERLGIVDLDDVRQWQVISQAAYMSRLLDRREFALGEPLAIAADVTPDRSWSAVAAAAPLRSGAGRGVELVDHRPGTGWLLPRLRQLKERHRPVVVVTSDRALADAAEKGELPVIYAGSGNMASAAGMLFDAVAGESPDVWMLRGQAEVEEAMAGATKRVLGDGWAWDRRSVSVDISPLVACSLALWGLSTTRLHEPTLTPFFLFGD